MIKENGKFIYTDDEKVKNDLEALGYTLLQKTENHWVFINKDSAEVQNFSKKTHVACSNTLRF